MSTQDHMKSPLYLSASLVSALLLSACDSADNTTDAGAEAGVTAGVATGGTSAEAGVSAGVEAGVEAGVTAGTEAGTSGAEVEVGRIDPSTPLPTPTETTLEPPASINEPREGATNEGCTGTWVEETRGWVVDERGQPLEGAKVQLCVREAESGTLSCLMPADSATDGSFSVSVPQNARCMSEATFRSLVPRERFATMYCHADLATASDDGALRVLEPLVLYETRPALEVSEGDASVSVSLPNELSVTFQPDDLFGADPDELWSRQLPPTAPGLCFLKEASGQVDGLFTFSPEGDLSGSSSAVRFPNEIGYAPMSEVALYVLGNLDCSVVGQEEGIPEGEWARAGSAFVDASGMWIEADAEQGLPCFSWFGYGPLP